MVKRKVLLLRIVKIDKVVAATTIDHRNGVVKLMLVDWRKSADKLSGTLRQSTKQNE